MVEESSCEKGVKGGKIELAKLAYDLQGKIMNLIKSQVKEISMIMP